MEEARVVFTIEDLFGVSNADGTPSNFYVYGTGINPADTTSGQSIKIAGNGQLAAAVYAPAADVVLNGGGTMAKS